MARRKNALSNLAGNYKRKATWAARDVVGYVLFGEKCPRTQKLRKKKS